MGEIREIDGILEDCYNKLAFLKNIFHVAAHTELDDFEPSLDFWSGIGKICDDLASNIMDAEDRVCDGCEWYEKQKEEERKEIEASKKERANDLQEMIYTYEKKIKQLREEKTETKLMSFLEEKLDDLKAAKNLNLYKGKDTEPEKGGES